MQKVVYFGKEYEAYDVPSSTISALANVEHEEELYKQSLEEYVSGVEGIDEPVEGKKFTKKRTYNKEITYFKQVLQEKGKLTPEIEQELDKVNNNLVCLNDDFNNVQDKYLAKYQAQRRIMTNQAIKQIDYIKNNSNSPIKYDDVQLTYLHPVDALKVKINYNKIFKSGKENIKKIENARPDSGTTFKNNLIEIMTKLNDKNMIDQDNYQYEEGSKRYAARKLYESRYELMSQITVETDNMNPDEDKRSYMKNGVLNQEKYNADLEKYQNEVSEKVSIKADNFDIEKFKADYQKYEQEKADYKEMLDFVKEKFSKEDHCTNIDVIRNSDSDAIITEDTHTSNILSGAFTMLKFIKQYYPEAKTNPNMNEVITKFIDEPGEGMKEIVKSFLPNYSNSNFKGLGRGQMLAKMDMLSANIDTGIGEFVKALDRFEECYSTIFPNNKPEYTLNLKLALNAPVEALGNLSKRVEDSFREENIYTLFEKACIFDDATFTPENFNYGSYYDMEKGEFIEDINVDDYFKNNDVKGMDVYNRIAPTIVDYYNTVGNNPTSNTLMTYVAAAQNLASDMCLKHGKDLTKQEFKLFENMALNPIKAFSSIGLDGAKMNKDMQDLAQNYKQKQKDLSNAQKELNAYEKFVVKKENEYNKQMAKFNKDIDKATKKNDTATVESLKAQMEELKAQRIQTIMRDYNANKLPESYAINRIDSIIKGDLKEVKGIFKTSGFKNAEAFCAANDLEGLSKEEMEETFNLANDEKDSYLKQKVGLEKVSEKIDILEEFNRLNKNDRSLNKKVVEGLEQEFIDKNNETNLSKTQEVNLENKKEVSKGAK